MRFKKLLAATLSMTMVFASSAVVFAEDSTKDPATGSTSATGEVEGYVSTDVFTVVLPTTPTEGSTFDFILDPQGLIEKTTQAAYSGKTFETGATLFFANTDATYSYSSTSDELTITNKSSMDVDVSVEATLSGIDDITMTSDDTFTDDTSTSMYLALVSGDTTTELTSSGASLTGTIDAAPDSAFEYTYSDGEYSYGLISDTSTITFSTYTFKMTGACNSNGDWSDLTEAAPAVDVTWTVTAHVADAAPSIAKNTYTWAADTDLVIPISMGVGELAATDVTVTFVTTAGTTKAMTSANSSYDADAGTYTIFASQINTWMTNFPDGQTLTFTFMNTARNARRR